MKIKWRINNRIIDTFTFLAWVRYWDDGHTWKKIEKWKCWLLSHIRLFPTLMDYSPPGSSVRRILQARIPEAIPFSRGSSWPRDWTWVSCTAGRFFIIWATREVPWWWPLVGFKNISDPDHLSDATVPKHKLWKQKYLNYEAWGWGCFCHLCHLIKAPGSVLWV